MWSELLLVLVNSLEGVSLQKISLGEGGAAPCDRRDTPENGKNSSVTPVCIVLDISGNLRKNCMIWPF